MCPPDNTGIVRPLNIFYICGKNLYNCRKRHLAPLDEQAVNVVKPLFATLHNYHYRFFGSINYAQLGGNKKANAEYQNFDHQFTCLIRNTLQTSLPASE